MKSSSADEQILSVDSSEENRNTDSKLVHDLQKKVNELEKELAIAYHSINNMKQERPKFDKIGRPIQYNVPKCQVYYF